MALASKTTQAVSQASRNAGPKVTVVTIAYNCVDMVERTLVSVTCQSYSNIEYIVIDGGSNDGTLDIIRRYEAQIDGWTSEKDTGIYNAMNKGVDRSTGDWIVFMNAGDCFESSETVANVVPLLDDRYGVVAGAVRYRFGEEHTRIKRVQPRLGGFSMVVPHHQASFIDNRLMKRYRYDESFRIRGDLNLMVTLHEHGHSFLMVDEVVANVDTTGVSTGMTMTHVTEEIRAGNRILRFYGAKCVAYHAFYVAPRLMLRKLLPKRLESKIRSLIRN